MHPWRNAQNMKRKRLSIQRSRRLTRLAKFHLNRVHISFFAFHSFLVVVHRNASKSSRIAFVSNNNDEIRNPSSSSHSARRLRFGYFLHGLYSRMSYYGEFDNCTSTFAEHSFQHSQLVVLQAKLRFRGLALETSVSVSIDGGNLTL